MSNTRYRVAIIGTGGIAKKHAQAFAALGDRVESLVAMDTDADRLDAFADEHRIEHRFTDMDAMLTSHRPHLVSICTPPHVHCDLSVRCLERGAWVLCEKPIAGSLAEVDRMIEAERHSDGFCASVFQWRYGSGARHVRGLIESGAFGRPTVGLCATTWYRGQGYYDVPWRGRWDTELGGATLSMGIHAIDLFTWLMGEWAEIEAQMGTLDRAIEVEDVSVATLRFESGALGSLINSVLSPRGESRLRMDFQHATTEAVGLHRFDNDDWRITAAPEIDEAQADAWGRFPENVQSTHEAQISALFEDMDAGRAPLTSGGEMRRAIELITALYKSAQERKPIERGSIQPGDPYYDALSGRPRQETKT